VGNNREQVIGKGARREKISWLKNDSWEEKKIDTDHERAWFCGIEWS
jgi:hypothetical protein